MRVAVTLALVCLPTDIDGDLLGMPEISESTFPSFQTSSIARPEFETPPADRLIRNGDPSFSQEVLNASEAQRETVVQPYRAAGHIGWKPMTVISGLALADWLSLPEACSA